MKNQLTVADYLIEALKAVNIGHVFGVPGDFSFSVTDAICHSDGIEWVGSSNELNGSYAADGYARIRGIGALSTTYGPGELSALCGLAGAYSANLPIIFIVGMPTLDLMQTDKLIHHTLGDGNFNHFVEMATPVTCAQTVLKAHNAAEEIQRVIQAALTNKRPVYIGVPEDVAYVTLSSPMPFDFSFENPMDLAHINELATAIADKINGAKSPLILVGEHLRAYQAKDSALALIDTVNLPFITLFADKGLLDETNPRFLGVYRGLLKDHEFKQRVEACDCLVNLGALFTDLNMDGYSVTLPEPMIHIMGDRVEFDGHVVQSVNMNALIEAITPLLTPKVGETYPCFMGIKTSNFDAVEKVTAGSLYLKLEHFFKEGDLIIAETGTVSMGLSMARFPTKVTYQNQALWASIGWATPAAFGASLAVPDKRTILLTGEGSHQLTIQELGHFYHYGLKPIIIVLNNNGYLIERLLCREPEIAFNDLVQWEYTQMPSAFGAKDWLVKRVTSNQELDDALLAANQADCGVYIEVMTESMDAPEVAINLAARLNPQRGIPVHIKPVEY